jgi:hypothetical protein
MWLKVASKCGRRLIAVHEFYSLILAKKGIVLMLYLLLFCFWAVTPLPKIFENLKLGVEVY